MGVQALFVEVFKYYPIVFFLALFPFRCFIFRALFTLFGPIGCLFLGLLRLPLLLLEDKVFWLQLAFLVA